LEEVMGSALSQEQKRWLWKQLGIVLKSHIYTVFNYKQFCGIAAMTERLLCKEFSTSGSKSSSSESKSEIEVADFDRILSKIENIQMNQNLRDLLVKVKESGMTKMNASKSGHILTRRRSKFEFI
jgi:hypothetical protein